MISFFFRFTLTDRKEIYWPYRKHIKNELNLSITTLKNSFQIRTMFSNNLNYRRHIFNPLDIFNNNKSFHSRCRAINRVGPHNQDVISVIFFCIIRNT
jgi:hypothetical protein